MFSHLKPVNIQPVYFWGVGLLKSSDKLQCIIYIRGLSGKALDIWGWSCLGQTQPGKLLLSSLASAWLA